MTSGNCPSYADLLAAVEAGVLPGSIERHRSACAICSRRIEEITELMGALPELALEAVSGRSLRAALALDQPDSIAARIGLFVAKLMPGSGSEALPAFRGTDSETLQRFAFSAGPFELELAHLANGALVGQVTSATVGTSQLGQARCVLYGSEESWESGLRSGRLFRFQDVRAGEYVLIVEAEENGFVVPRISL